MPQIFVGKCDDFSKIGYGKGMRREVRRPQLPNEHRQAGIDSAMFEWGPRDPSGCYQPILRTSNPL